MQNKLSASAQNEKVFLNNEIWVIKGAINLGLNMDLLKKIAQHFTEQNMFLLSYRQKELTTLEWNRTTDLEQIKFSISNHYLLFNS